MKNDPRLPLLLEQIIRLTKGDFTSRENSSGKGDELDEVFAAVNLLGEDLHARNLLIKENEKRLGRVMEALILSTQLNFSQKLEISSKGDELDAIALGINTMAEELEAHIDELDKSRQKITHALEQLTDAQHMAHVGSWEWDVPADSINWSDELYHIYGKDRANFKSTFENYMACIHPEDRAVVGSQIQGAYKEKKPFSFFHRVMYDNGDVRFLDCKVEVMLDDRGEVCRMTGTAQDITERKIAEQNISRLASIVESSGDAIISKTLGGIITSWNKQAVKLFGYTPDEIIGKHVSLLFPEERLSEEDAILEKIRRGESIPDYETERKRKDGTVFPISVTISPIYDMNGEIIGVSKIARDITEKKNNERRIFEYTRMLEQKNKESREFAYVASHDLQEPLRTITNYIGLFEEEYKGKLGEEGDLYLGFIDAAAERMKRLISDLLDYSRIETDREVVAIDCNEIIKEVRQDFEVIIAENKAKITSDDLPVIHNDYSRIKSLFQNLVSNGIKFRRKDVPPVIHIGVKDRGEDWEFSVTDNGIGIEKTYDEKIFMLFQRLHNRSEYKGTGIGLAHCKKIVELSGGRIWMESVPGAGSTFHFTLPKKLNL